MTLTALSEPVGVSVVNLSILKNGRRPAALQGRAFQPWPVTG
jgi:hypothetical protein